MAQCFVTTYRNHYRWYRNAEKREPIKANVYEMYEKAIPREDIWLEQKDEEELDPEVLTDALRQNRQKIMTTMYQHYFCRDRTSDATSENQLMKYCKNLYEPDTLNKVLPPSAATRRYFGYIRPTRNYTPMTTYQNYIGKVAYKVLKGDFNKESTRNLEKIEGEEETKRDVICECCHLCRLKVQ